MTVKQYCKQNNCSSRTWYRVKNEYNRCENKDSFTHAKKCTGPDPFLSSSGEKCVSDKLERTISGTVNSGVIKQSVVKRLFDKYQRNIERASRPYTIKLMKKLGFIYGTTTYKTHNKINVPDSVLIAYQNTYRNLLASGVELKSILNVDATKCYGDLVIFASMKEHISHMHNKLITEQ